MSETTQKVNIDEEGLSFIELEISQMGSGK